MIKVFWYVNSLTIYLYVGSFEIKKIKKFQFGK